MASINNKQFLYSHIYDIDEISIEQFKYIMRP